MANLHIAHEIFDLIYPVGSIYMSANNVNPSTLFGGTWVQIKGRFLLGTGNCDANTDTFFGTIKNTNWNAGAGSKGGEDYHSLTQSEMPKHKHYINLSSGSSGEHYHTVRFGGADGSPVVISYGSGPTRSLNLPNWEWVNASYENLYATYAGNHAHSISGDTQHTGDTSQHNNMPPYFAVNIWRRTA